MQDRKKLRVLNGYRVIYLPDYPKSMVSENWKGWVYEHVVCAEESLGRPLRNNEVVHHLDGNRSNNRYDNLLILENPQHGRLHFWLKIGAPFEESKGENRLNSGKPTEDKVFTCITCGETIQSKNRYYCSSKCNPNSHPGVVTTNIKRGEKRIPREPSFCKICGGINQSRNKHYCSVECSSIANRKVKRPSYEELKKDIETMNFLEMSRKYGVSDNAIRKWARIYGLPWQSRAKPSEKKDGVETTCLQARVTDTQSG